jgi:hypothetical protein
MRSAPEHEFANVRGNEQVLSEEAKGYGLDPLHIAKLEPRERVAELLVTNRSEPFRSFVNSLRHRGRRSSSILRDR